MEALDVNKLKFYEGIRYIHGGNNLSGADCFGIIKLVNKREYGVDIGEYERSTTSAFAFRSIDAYFKEIIKDKWKEVDPYTGCTVVVSHHQLSDGSYPATHVGIYVEPGMVLSTDLGTGISRIVPLEGLHILGYYEFNNN